MRDITLDADKKKNTRFFLVTGDSPYHAGSLQLPWGAIVGLPYNFGYKSVDEIDTRNISAYNGQPIKWDTSTGKKLKETLYLSPAAQKFAIAKEIYFSDSYMVHVRAMAVFASLMLFKAIIDVGKQRYSLTSMPWQTRTLVYIASTVLCLSNFLLLNDGVNSIYDRETSLQAALVSDEYYDGATEFYTKLLQRNKCFRRLLGN